jgi:hypothetical protein
MLHANVGLKSKVPFAFQDHFGQEVIVEGTVRILRAIGHQHWDRQFFQVIKRRQGKRISRRVAITGSSFRIGRIGDDLLPLLKIRFRQWHAILLPHPVALDHRQRSRTALRDLDDLVTREILVKAGDKKGTRYLLKQ